VVGRPLDHLIRANQCRCSVRCCSVHYESVQQEQLAAADSTAQHTRGDAEAERQHKHDAKRKDQDRKGVIRREAYVKTIEAAYASPGACRAWGVDSEK